MVEKGDVYKMLENVVDPELMIGVLDLGLVYRVDVKDDVVEIEYTLTYPGCPAGALIEDDIQRLVRQLPDVKDVTTKVVWEPQWRPDFMSEAARLDLGYPI